MSNEKIDGEWQAEEHKFCEELVAFLNEKDAPANMIISGLSRILALNAFQQSKPAEAILGFAKVLLDDYYTELINRMKKQDD